MISYNMFSISKINSSESFTCVSNSAKSIFIKNEYSLPKLNEHLSDKSYLDNTVYPTELDRETFEIVKKRHNFQNITDNAEESITHLPHFFRWFRHIASFNENQRLSFLPNESQLNDSSNMLQNSIVVINNRVGTQMLLFCFCVNA